MPTQAVVFRAMIASPSDVAAERQQIREVIAEWTAVHSQDKGAVLLPVGWESHSAPEMGARPQDIINRRLLKDCDLLVAALWTRIGTPTGDAVSGTVEEIEEHIATGKPAMIYFSRRPVEPDSIDQDQYNELKTFRSRCQTRGLYETYDSLSDFRDKFARQLAVTMIRLCAEAPRNAGVVVATDFILSEADPSPPQPNLSRTAQRLLKNISLDSHGTLLRVRVIGGTVIQAQGKQLNAGSDARENAKYEAAIEELADALLIRQSDSKGEIFRLTHQGYAVADTLPSDIA